MVSLKKAIFMIVLLSVFLLECRNIPDIPRVFADKNEISASLSGEIETIINSEPHLNGSIAGISIRNQKTGDIVYEHMSNIRLAPASNMKLFTAAAALNVLGEDYRFITEIYTDGQITKGTLKGNLYIKGNGDTSLLPEDLEKMAKELKDKGISSIEGDIIADDSWYDSIPYSIDLAWSDESSYYGAPISALTLSPTKEYDAGTILLEVEPSKNIGKKVEIKSSPKLTGLTIINKAKTVSSDGENSLRITRKHHYKTIMIEGNLPINSAPKKEWISVDDPTSYVLDVFQQSLSKEGITWTGKGEKGKTPLLASLLTTHSSIPLSELLVPFMKLSNNTIAETLVKELGVVKKNEGSFKLGLEVLEKEISSYSIDTSHMLIRDGSGVSPIDLVTANDVSQFLFEVQREKWFPILYASLPISGEPERFIGGTLRNRLTGASTKGKVYAKTGTLSAVSSLSGYIETNNGNQYIFSILLNHLMDEEKGKIIEDKLVETLAKY